jgi:PhoH-like ATPase
LKKYVIDTNSLLDFPEIVYNQNYSFHIPSSVINELDNLKREKRTSIFARAAARAVFNSVKAGNCHMHNFGDNIYADNDVISLAKVLECGIITSDVGLALKATGIEVKHVDDFLDFERFSYSRDLSDQEDYCGFAYIDGKVGYYNGRDFITYNDKEIKLSTKVKVKHSSLEQAFLIGGMFDEDIKLMIITGNAGTGKTYVTLASALELVENGVYSNILWAVPPVPVGGVDRYGFVPGDLEEKIKIYLGGLQDNIEKLGYDYEMITQRGVIKPIPFNLIRGRSISNAIVVVDEAQNASKLEIKTMLSRAEDSSKFILLGDLGQSDKYSPTLSGLYTVMSSFNHSHDFIGMINLIKNKRGKLATLSCELL